MSVVGYWLFAATAIKLLLIVVTLALSVATAMKSGLLMDCCCLFVCLFVVCRLLFVNCLSFVVRL